MQSINLQLVFASISLLQLLYRGNGYTRKYQYLEIVLKFLASTYTCAEILQVFC